MLKETGGYHDFGHLEDSIDPVTEAGLADFIEATTKITDEVSLIPTPGHTPGHVSVLIRSKGQEAIITGDMMHHPIQLAESDRTGNFDMDQEQGIATRKAMFERVADKDVLLIVRISAIRPPAMSCAMAELEAEGRGMNWDLKDQAVLVTGAGRGLGRAVAELLATSGASVGVCDVDVATCRETAANIRNAGGRAAEWNLSSA